MNKGIILKIIVLVLMILGTTPGFAEKFKVIRVIDGDTIDVDYHGHRERVRLLCVNTPESVHPNRSRNTPMGTTASLYTKKILTGKSVDLEFEGNRRGRFKRLLAYVIVDNANFNLDLVEQGFSPYYTRYGLSKAYDRRFRQAEQRAKEKGLNIWNGKQIDKKAPSLAAAPPGTSVLHGNVESRVVHTPSCRYFSCKQCTVIFHSRAAALAAGFKPCRICTP